MVLRFERYRLREKVAHMTDDEVDVLFSGSWVGKRKLTVAKKRGELERLWDESFAPVEIVDVVGEKAPLYWMYFGCYGSAWLFDAKTKKLIATAADHSVDQCPSRELWEALGAAYRTSRPKIRQRINFTIAADARFPR